MLEQLGTAVVEQHRTPGYYTVAVPDGEGLFDTISKAAKRKEVLFAEPSEFGVDDALTMTAKQAQAYTVDPDVDADGDEDLLAEIVTPDVFGPGEPPPPDDLESGEETEDALSDIQALPTDTHFGRLWGCTTQVRGCGA